MVFSSSLFLFYFLPLFLLCYHLFKNIRYKNSVILIFSLFFYAWGAPYYVFVVVGFTVLDFYTVKIMDTMKKINHRRWLLAVSVVTNLGFLLYFKYANFFMDNFDVLLNSIGFSLGRMGRIMLPIGISFFTFQSLTYSIDVYRKEYKPAKSVLDYLVFVTCFPQMIAGPIVRYSAVANEIPERKESLDEKLIGVYRFCIGLAKKALIANVIGKEADIIFNGNLTHLGAGDAWVGMIAYTFQIYFDFAGYSDMAIGLAKIMGLHFPENFDSPYISKNISEFWRRWHITLGDFMRDYLYIPLGGNRVKTKRRLFFNLWVVFLISGLWHGAAWNFVIWGAYHGVFLVMDRLFLVKFLNRLGKWPSIIITFLIVMFGWIIFRIENMHKAVLYFKGLFNFSGENLHITPSFFAIAIIAAFFSIQSTFKWGKKLENFFFFRESYSLATNTGLMLLSVLLFIISVSYINSSGFNPFIYFRF